MTAAWGRLWFTSVPGSMWRFRRWMLKVWKAQLPLSLSRSKYPLLVSAFTFPSWMPIFTCPRFLRVSWAQNDGWPADSERPEADRPARPRPRLHGKTAGRAADRERPQQRRWLEVPDKVHFSRNGQPCIIMPRMINLFFTN